MKDRTAIQKLEQQLMDIHRWGQSWPLRDILEKLSNTSQLSLEKSDIFSPYEKEVIEEAISASREILDAIQHRRESYRIKGH